VEGLKDLRKEGRFVETSKNIEAMHSFKIENSPLLEFLTQNYEPCPDEDRRKYGVSISDLFSQYRNYCLDGGYKPKAMANFTRELSHTVLQGWDIEKIKDGSKTVVIGLRKLRSLGGEEIVYQQPQYHHEQ
jgi:hypothetical protein